MSIDNITQEYQAEVDRLEGLNNQLEADLGTIAQAKADTEQARDDAQQSAQDSNLSAVQSESSNQSSGVNAASASTSALEAKGFRDQASEIAGLDDVAAAMGIVSRVYGVHDLDIPFNDGIDVTHGYGPVAFSRLSAATGTNKSGIPQTYLQDEPVITSAGCAFFGDVTNYVSNWNEVAWSEATLTPTPQNRLLERNVAMTPDGLMEADRITASQDLDLQRVFFSTGSSLGNGDSWSITVKADISDRVQIRTSANAGVTVSLLDGSVIRDNTNGNFDVEPLVGGWFRISIFGNIETVGWVQLLDSSNNATFDGSTNSASVLICNAQRSDGAFVPPPVPTTGAAVTREGETATIPQIGNLPRPGDPFYIVADVDAAEPTSSAAVVLGGLYSTIASLNLPATGVVRLTLVDEAGSQVNADSQPRTKRRSRLIAALNGLTVSFYEDGVPLGAATYPEVTSTFKHQGDLQIGTLNGSSNPLNGYQKNLKIKHGVMTDDLAKAYGSWGQ